MGKYRYFRGSKDSYEVVEFDITKGDRYITTCAVNVRLLTDGIRTQPCGNGDDVKLTPEQQLEILNFIKEERKKLTAAEIKTLKGWHESGLPTWEDYCRPGEKVTEDIVDYFANCVPPVTYQHGFVQAGEPYSHEQDEHEHYRATYTTFTAAGTDTQGSRIWLHNGCCFKGETVNRVDRKTRLEERLEELEREIKRGEQRA